MRRTLIKVREDYIKWVDSFTQQFINSLKDIETSRDMQEFKGIDCRMHRGVEELRAQYVEIIRIFTDISKAPIEKKLHTIEANRDRVREIEQLVKQRDLDMGK